MPPFSCQDDCMIISAAVEMPLSPCCRKQPAAERLPHMFTLSHPHTLIIRQLPAAVCLTEPNHYLPLISCSDTACCGCYFKYQLACIRIRLFDSFSSTKEQLVSVPLSMLGSIHRPGKRRDRKLPNVFEV
ncbi:hypothetical protein DPX16_12969 [Anabarilius grahami]|uniref:Uncharacterized protein n=1 Tax=Anabarilius grahami TaxID=495550 RepID=A0A3N0XDE6_ANAGA|nr:hypothetical protein DPX16_12969 [Anabarilius grahami]